MSMSMHSLRCSCRVCTGLALALAKKPIQVTKELDLASRNFPQAVSATNTAGDSACTVPLKQSGARSAKCTKGLSETWSSIKLVAEVSFSSCALMSALMSCDKKTSRAFCSDSVVKVSFEPLSNPQGDLCRAQQYQHNTLHWQTHGDKAQYEQHLLDAQDERCIAVKPRLVLKLGVLDVIPLRQLH